MELTDAVRIPLAPAAVAEALSELALVRTSLENCEAFSKLSDGEYALTFTVPVGPLRGRYDVRVHVSDVDVHADPQSGRAPIRALHRVINFKAGAAGVGSLRGQIEIALYEEVSSDIDPDVGLGEAQPAQPTEVVLSAQTTRVDYAIWTTLTGPLAALPPGQIENALQELAEDFFQEFAAVVVAKHGKGPNRAAPGAASRRQHIFLRPINLAGFSHRNIRADVLASAQHGRLSSLLLGHRDAHGLGDRQAPQAMPPWAWALAIILVGALLYLLHCVN